jgi:hypothetical protein
VAGWGGTDQHPVAVDTRQLFRRIIPFNDLLRDEGKQIHAAECHGVQKPHFEDRDKKVCKEEVEVSVIILIDVYRGSVFTVVLPADDSRGQDFKISSAK